MLINKIITNYFHYLIRFSFRFFVRSIFFKIFNFQTGHCVSRFSLNCFTIFFTSIWIICIHSVSLIFALLFYSHVFNSTRKFRGARNMYFWTCSFTYLTGTKIAIGSLWAEYCFFIFWWCVWKDLLKSCTSHCWIRSRFLLIFFQFFLVNRKSSLRCITSWTLSLTFKILSHVLFNIYNRFWVTSAHCHAWGLYDFISRYFLSFQSSWLCFNSCSSLRCNCILL